MKLTADGGGRMAGNGSHNTAQEHSTNTDI